MPWEEERRDSVVAVGTKSEGEDEGERGERGDFIFFLDSSVLSLKFCTST